MKPGERVERGDDMADIRSIKTAGSFWFGSV